MTSVAIILNIFLLTLAGYLLIIEGLPSSDNGVLFILFLFILNPLVNLWVFLFSANPSKNKNFISLYSERKSLEEKKRIDQLNQK